MKRKRSSRECPKCKAQNWKTVKKDWEYVCKSCGHVMSRILKIGLGK